MSTDDMIEYRRNQLCNSKGAARAYYATEMHRAHREKVKNDEYTNYQYLLNPLASIDLHGMTKNFVDLYLLQLIEYKKKCRYNEISIVAGRGTGTIFKHVKELLDEHRFKYKVINYAFTVKL